MLRFIDHTKMGRGQHGWLDSHFHFSFAEYHNPGNMHFGVLRVLNDDLVQPGTGFDTHPHRDMEIISYVVDGALTHADSMGHKRTLTRGQVQYMSAGTGVFHSEHNLADVPLRFLQIWLVPDRRGYEPRYGDIPFPWADRVNRWLPIATGDAAPAAPIHVHADVHVFATEITDEGELSFPVAAGRQAYLVLIEGAADVSGQKLSARDALEIAEQDVSIRAKGTAHVLMIEMQQNDRG
ncbi:MAG: pirin family protein [Oscillospiraceae bacterium]|jgi:redox-sensitive bicupin YhaK (pirin superfamily)|nr:pirin family protein [Oscillospiraceae bacterium]